MESKPTEENQEPATQGEVKPKEPESKEDDSEYLQPNWD
jgi:hypothetical protein